MTPTAGLAAKLNSPAARNRKLETTLSDLHHRATHFAEMQGTIHDGQQVATHEHQGWQILVKIDARHTIKPGYPIITCVRPGHSIEVSFPTGHQYDCSLTRGQRTIMFTNGKVVSDNGPADSQPAEDLLQAVLDMIPQS